MGVESVSSIISVFGAFISAAAACFAIFFQKKYQRLSAEFAIDKIQTDIQEKSRLFLLICKIENKSDVRINFETFNCQIQYKTFSEVISHLSADGQPKFDKNLEFTNRNFGEMIDAVFQSPEQQSSTKDRREVALSVDGMSKISLSSLLLVPDGKDIAFVKLEFTPKFIDDKYLATAIFQLN